MNDQLLQRYRHLREALDAAQAEPEPDLARIDALMRELDELQLASKDSNPRHFGNNPIE